MNKTAKLIFVLSTALALLAVALAGTTWAQTRGSEATPAGRSVAFLEDDEQESCLSSVQDGADMDSMHEGLDMDSMHEGLDMDSMHGDGSGGMGDMMGEGSEGGCHGSDGSSIKSSSL